MKFCKRCQNAYEPDQIQTTDKQLMFICKACKYEHIETDPAQFKIASTDYNIDTDNELIIDLIYVPEDKTVPVREMPCKNNKCDNKYIKYVIRGDNLKVTYVCGTCRNIW